MLSQENGGTQTVRVNFCVDVKNLLPSRCVYVTGNDVKLGEWRPEHAMVLKQSEENINRWSGSVDTELTTLKFRYFTGYYLNADDGPKLIIDKWESFLHPRTFTCSGCNSEKRIDYIDPFGYYAGRKNVSDGFLQHADENEILLRVHGKALKFFNSTKVRTNCKIKVTPMDVRNRQIVNTAQVLSQPDEEEDDDDSAGVQTTHSQTDVAVLSDPKSRFYTQQQHGTVFNNFKDYIVFKTRSVAVEFLAFYLELFSEENKKIGTCVALPDSLKDAGGISQLAFTNSMGRPIGQISLDYLFVRALIKPVPPVLMDKTFCRHWKKRNTLEVGHRGAGNSYTKFAVARENTIHSLNHAAKHGADYVEFDVQLTKDKVAIIYHDFHVLVSVARRQQGHQQTTPREVSDAEKSLEFHELPVKDLNLGQLKLLMLDHLAFPQHKKENVKKLVESGEEADDFKPFPTLVEALTKVQEDVGFNVEIKYPMMQNNGEHECDHYFERNEFVDIILADVLNNVGSRRIMFSSFDPDICALVSSKQNMYPVQFLCVGETQRYTPFQDQRTSTSLAAVNFAVCADLLGVNFNSEDLLRDPDPVVRAKEHGLITFVWGDDLDNKETIKYFKNELGVDGVIYDRIGEEEGRRNVFIVEREQKKALLSTSGTTTPLRSTSPVTYQASKLKISRKSDPLVEEEIEDAQISEFSKEQEPNDFKDRMYEVK